jgi:hypothetical protein
MKFCRHVSNSPRDKNKILLNPYLIEKVFFWAFKTLLSSFGTREKSFLSTLNVMISQTIKSECVRFGGHVHIEVSYRILQLEILNEVSNFLNLPCF